MYLSNPPISYGRWFHPQLVHITSTIKHLSSKYYSYRILTGLITPWTIAKINNSRWTKRIIFNNTNLFTALLFCKDLRSSYYLYRKRGTAKSFMNLNFVKPHRFPIFIKDIRVFARIVTFFPPMWLLGQLVRKITVDRAKQKTTLTYCSYLLPKIITFHTFGTSFNTKTSLVNNNL